MLEDGVEMDNRVYKNLAVQMMKLEFVGCDSRKNLTCAQRSDHAANGFWIPNPENFWEDNVAVSTGGGFFL